jgi:hypothetical protein
MTEAERGHSIIEVGMETASGMNHNVHYVETLGRQIDYVVLCMHGVAWNEMSLGQLRYPVISDSGVDGVTPPSGR